MKEQLGSRIALLLVVIFCLTYPIDSFHCSRLPHSISSRLSSSLHSNFDDSLTVAELKERLKERGLPVSGLKAVLLKRLRESEESLQEKNADALRANRQSDELKSQTSTSTMLDSKKEGKERISNNDLDELESLMTEGEAILKLDKDTQHQGLLYGVPDIALIQSLVDQRHLYRMARDFEKADAIYDKLRTEFGVEIRTSQGVWRASDGTKGPLYPKDRENLVLSEKLTGSPSVPLKMLGSDEACKLTNSQIQRLVDERTQNRRKRLFNEADKIRDSLAAEGVELLDNDDSWQTTNGKMSGSQSNIDKY